MSVLGAAEHHRTDDPALDTPEKIVLVRDSPSLRTVIDKMKSFDKHVVVSAAQLGQQEQRRRGDGWLKLTTGTGVVEVETKFDGMEIRLPQQQAAQRKKRKKQGGGSGENGDSGSRGGGEEGDGGSDGSRPDAAGAGGSDGDEPTPEPLSGQTPSVVKVDVKQLSQAMATTSVRSEDIAFCLSTDYVLILYIKLHSGAGHLTLYLQGLERDEFDGEDSDVDMDE